MADLSATVHRLVSAPSAIINAACALECPDEVAPQNELLGPQNVLITCPFRAEGSAWMAESQLPAWTSHGQIETSTSDHRAQYGVIACISRTHHSRVRGYAVEEASASKRIHHACHVFSACRGVPVGLCYACGRNCFDKCVRKSQFRYDHSSCKSQAFHDVERLAFQIC